MANSVDKEKLLTLPEFKNLKPEELDVIDQIITEMNSSGYSSLYEKLRFADFREIPVDILTFVDDNNYLGNAWHDAQGNSKLYPYWREELKKVFPNNMDLSVNNVILGGSRGRGKTEIAVLMIAYQLYKVLCLKNPLEYFHLKPTEKAVFAFMNIKLALAEEIGVSKFQNTIQSSPWFLSHGEVTGRTRKIWVPMKFNGQDVVEIKIGSQADDLIGLPVLGVFFDEISFIKNLDIEIQKRKANDMIDTALGGMKTRFIHNGKNPTLLILASSKRSDKAFLEDHMKKKVKSEKDNVYISEGSVWAVKPKGTYSEETFKVALGNKFLPSIVLKDNEEEITYIKKGYKILEVPIDFKADFLDDIDRALCDFAGIASSNLSKYINGENFCKLINPTRVNPFSKEILEVGNGADDTAQYSDYFDLTKINPKLKSRPLYIHLDMSISGDKTGIAGVWITGKKISTDGSNMGKDLFYTLAFSVSIKAPKGRQISFEKNRNFIRWLKKNGFNIKGVSSDTFQSYDLQQQLTSEGYSCSIISVDRVQDKICKPYQNFKSIIDEGRLDVYESKQLLLEVTDLERDMDTGKVDHSTDGCFTGDTKVSLVDGRELSFEELVDEYKQGKSNYVYSFNHQTNQIEPKPIKKAWMTIKNARLVEVELDNGEIIRCTPNHRFMLRDGSYIEAENLRPGQPLMPLYRKIGKVGLAGYRLYYSPLEEVWHYEHRQFVHKYNETIKKTEVVHHINFNKLDNTPTNLKIMSRNVHTRLHNREQSDEERSKRSLSIKKWHKEHRGTEEYATRSEKIRQALYVNLGEEAANKRVAKRARIAEIERIFDVEWDKLTLSEKNRIGNKYARMIDPTIQQRTSAALSQRHKEGLFTNAKIALQRHNDSVRGKPRSPEDRQKMREGQRRIREYKNHKVVAVRYLDYTEDVYDIEVADNHNFALSSGIFVHNSKDCSDAVCGALFNASQNAEQYAFDYGEDIETVENANASSNNESIRQQLSVDFNAEIQRMLDPVARRQKEIAEEANSNPSQPPKISSSFNSQPSYAINYLNDGIIVF